MKIIFLDIDGVLALCHKERDEYGSLFHEDFVNNLSMIIAETKAKIVISSSWRKSSFTIMKEMWAKRDMPGEVIDTTPSLYLKKGITFYNDRSEIHPTPRTSDYSIPRGCEIEYWLKDKGFQRVNYCKKTQIEYLLNSEIKNYVIIDDDSDMLYGQREHFVKTSGQSSSIDAIEGYGLTGNAAIRAIKILKTPLIDLYY